MASSNIENGSQAGISINKLTKSISTSNLDQARQKQLKCCYTNTRSLEDLGTEMEELKFLVWDVKLGSVVPETC